MKGRRSMEMKVRPKIIMRSTPFMIRKNHSNYLNRKEAGAT